MWVARQLAREFPDSNGAIEFRLQPLKELYVGDIRPYLLLLQGAVMLVLLIACVNIVHVLLAQALVRNRETAIRLALGAGQRQILKQWMLGLFVAEPGGWGVGSFCRLRRYSCATANSFPWNCHTG